MRSTGKTVGFNSDGLVMTWGVNFRIYSDGQLDTEAALPRAKDEDGLGLRSYSANDFICLRVVNPTGHHEPTAARVNKRCHSKRQSLYIQV